MKRRIQNTVVVLTFIIWLPVLVAPVSANQKAASLKKAMAELSLLHDQLVEKEKQTISIKAQLQEKIDELKKEILSERKDKKPIDFKAATMHPRIHYNLRLISEMLSYIDIYNEKSVFYKTGQDRLAYLYQQADDELKIINTLSDLKIDALIMQVKTVVEGYLPEAQTILISPNPFSKKSPQQIWDAL